MNSKQWIEEVTRSFYAKAKDDILIGYHFRVIENFDDHIPRIVAFWESQLLGRTETPINPPFDIFNVHIPLKIKRGELGRWLMLFRLTLSQLKSSEHHDLQEKWEQKLLFFEKAFLRFFRF